MRVLDKLLDYFSVDIPLDDLSIDKNDGIEIINERMNFLMH